MLMLPKFFKYYLPPLALAAIIFYLSHIPKAEIRDNNLFPENEQEITREMEIPEEKNGENKKNEEKLPDKIKISVSFTPQAPFANWDEYHKEACEEASLVMLKYYIDDLPLSAETAEREIQNLIAFQNKKYGDYKDTSTNENVKLAEDYYGINNLKVIYDFSPEDLKKYLAKGNPIIIPAAGRMLGNPYFTQPGPLYHNLVLTGYSGNTIITNDPGTKRGEDYKYDIQTLYNAIHDFPGNKEDIENGRKAMIVFE